MGRVKYMFHIATCLLITFVAVYGMVEASFITQTVYNEKSKEGSVGVLVPGLEGKVNTLTHIIGKLPE